MIYRALDIANYIIKKSVANQKPLSNLKLQKILYYLQARFLVETGQPLFADSIEKWKYGPVIESVYHEFKIYGSGVIDKVASNLIVERDSENNITDIRIETFNENTIDHDDKKIILETINALTNYGAFQLVNRTHEQTIWKDYEDLIMMGLGGTYNNEELINYFINNPEEQLWKKN